MKKLLTLLIALQLSMVFIGFQGFEGVLADTPNPLGPGAPPAPAAEPVAATSTTACVKVLADGTNTNTDTRPAPDASNIVVLLTEGIESGGEGASCGKIIECLRAKFAPFKATADGMVINELKAKHWQCIVSGKDGLDLLNNYAGLVYRWIAGIVGAICILMIIISGIQISMGGLSQEEVSEAKDRIVRSLTGMVVLFLSAFILYTINPIFFT